MAQTTGSLEHSYDLAPNRQSSYWRDALRRFRRNWLAVIGLFVVLAVVALAACAGLIAPNGYNTFDGNVRAGDRLKADGVIHANPDVQAWNGTVYPTGQPTATKIAARRCDFLTFIGRGYVQITGRGNYAKFSNRASLGNVDFVAEPLRVLEPAAAAGIQVQGMRDGEFRHNNKLADYDIAAGFDATNARDIVNGDKGTYGASIRDVAKKYKAALVFFPKLDESTTIV